MEYHWYEDYWAMPRNLPRGHEFFIGYYQTQRAIHHHVAFIHTDQSCFLSTQAEESIVPVRKRKNSVR